MVSVVVMMCDVTLSSSGWSSRVAHHRPDRACGPAPETLYSTETGARTLRCAAASAPAVDRECVGVCVLLQVGCHTNITVESLSLFYLLEPHIKVLGTGKKGIAVEVQDTVNAASALVSNKTLLTAG
uniref:Uncharacterized protein n=1 Tax=Sinocyclocheilus grahami TaxID=75366 RepID=A0A672PY10_SINGR